uniref:Ig-like domain-containing protein n=1 Tax=Cyanistes caeruleus TaxID=156563 RepID=A0A8C0U847_CYACU
PSEPARSPVLFPLYTCQDCEDQVTFACLASGFFPSPAEITWEGVAEGGAIREFQEVLMGAGRYDRSSRVTVGVAEAEGVTFRCRAEHRGSSVSIDMEGEKSLGIWVKNRWFWVKIGDFR